jgi:exopolyphosphatase/guanosine-5'-triphosphate,3'-diphosphate pyrophosphatase
MGTLRCACIDIGSNTTRLLVAQRDVPAAGEPAKGLREVTAERVFTAIGAAAGIDRSLPAAKIAEVAAVVAGQVGSARRAGADLIRVVATAAVRAAPNRDALSVAVKRTAGIDLEVLSGREEANLAFTGALASLVEAPTGRIAVIDVGGGSTELVVGSAAGGPTWSTSLGVGSSSLTERCVRYDPPSAACLAALGEAIAVAFAGLDPPAVELALAVGGSATTLLSLDGNEVDPESLAFLLAEFTAEPVLPTAVRLGLHPDRTRLLPAGIMLLSRASELLRKPLRIARGGLREGVILELLG